MENAQNKKMVKLTKEELQRSLTATNTISHLWLYKRNDTRQRTHNNSGFLTRTIGEPFACLVVKCDSCIYDGDIQDFFGKDVFIDGGVSPKDKEYFIQKFEAYYYKGYHTGA